MADYLELIEKHSELNLLKNALIFFDEIDKSFKTSTYLELFEKSYLLSAYLIEENIFAEPIVIIDNKNQITFTIIMACLFSGNSFCIINPQLPRDQITDQLKALKARHVWLSEKHEDLGELVSLHFPKMQRMNLRQYKSAAPDRRRSFDELKNLTAIITSTNQKISHLELNEYLLENNEILSLSPDDCLFNVSALSFNQTLGEVFLGLMNGASIACVNYHQFFMVPEIVKATNATIWFSTPALAKKLNDSRPYANEYYESIKKVIFYGDMEFQEKEIFPGTSELKIINLKWNK